MPTTGISFVYSSNIKGMSLSNLSWLLLPFQLRYILFCVCVTTTYYFIKDLTRCFLSSILIYIDCLVCLYCITYPKELKNFDKYKVQITETMAQKTKVVATYMMCELHRFTS
jgi:hypothetical protein